MRISKRYAQEKKEENAVYEIDIKQLKIKKDI